MDGLCVKQDAPAYGREEYAEERGGKGDEQDVPVRGKGFFEIAEPDDVFVEHEGDDGGGDGDLRCGPDPEWHFFLFGGQEQIISAQVG